MYCITVSKQPTITILMGQTHGFHHESLLVSGMSVAQLVAFLLSTHAPWCQHSVKTERWHMPRIPTLRSWGQEDQKFKFSST